MKQTATPFTHASDPLSGIFAAGRVEFLTFGEGPTGFTILLELPTHTGPARGLA